MWTDKTLRREYVEKNRKEWKTSTRLNPGEVVFLGYRTLANGKLIRDWEEGNSFEADHHFRACLVAPTDGKRNSFYVMEEDLKELRP